MSGTHTITPSDKALSQLPRAPVGADDQADYNKLLDALDRFLCDNDLDDISLEQLAKATEIPAARVSHFFPNAPAAAAGLTIRYVQLASNQIMSNQSASGSESWQDVVYEILRRGRAFFTEYPAAEKLRLGGGQSAGVRQLILQSTWSLAQVIKDELDRLFHVPPNSSLLDELAYAIVISDALWSVSLTLHGEITGEMAEEAERAVAALLEPAFGTRLPSRKD